MTEWGAKERAEARDDARLADAIAKNHGDFSPYTADTLGYEAALAEAVRLLKEYVHGDVPDGKTWTFLNHYSLPEER